MDKNKVDLKSGIATRARRVYLLFVLVAIFFLGRMVYIQLNPDVGKHLDTLLDTKIIKSSVVEPHRGAIYSRHGKMLATSVVMKDVRIDFSADAFRKRDKVRQSGKLMSQNLAEYFGDKSANEYYAEFIKCNNASYKYTEKNDTITHAWWKFWKKDTIVKVVKAEQKYPALYRSKKIFRDVTLNEWEELKKFPILNGKLGVTYRSTDYDRRIYPQGEIALRTIGRYDPDRGRRYGLEMAFNDTLSGHEGKQFTQILAVGYTVPIVHKDNVEVQHGYDIITTLDVDVQDVADKALRNQIAERRAEWGTTIVMECATGDILAIANIGRNAKGELYERQNYAIGLPINPGSTFKLVSAMALLEHGVPVSQKCNSGLGKTVVIAGAKIKDSHPIAKETGGVIDMHTAFTESANVYFAKVVHDKFYDNPLVFSDFCRKLNLHDVMGLEYLGARKGTIPHLDKKHPSRYNALANMAIGYNVDVTPLHMVTLYNAVANGGRMVAPRLILRIESDGKTVKEVAPRVINEQICSPETCKTLRSFMESVSMEGTAAAYFNEKHCHFRTGAKTGTARVKSVINGVDYSKVKGAYYYGTMITYFPADNPRYTIITSVFSKNHGDEKYYGATLAGPVQQRVASFLHNRDKEYVEQLSSESHYVQDIKGGSVESMREVAGEYAKEYTASERSGWGTSSLRGKSQEVVISQEDMPHEQVPNVVGMGLSDALYLLESRGLVVEIEGAGKVVKQSVEAGSAVKQGDKIKIVLK